MIVSVSAAHQIALKVIPTIPPELEPVYICCYRSWGWQPFAHTVSTGRKTSSCRRKDAGPLLFAPPLMHKKLTCVSSYPPRLLRRDVAPDIDSVIKFSHTADRNITRSKCSAGVSPSGARRVYLCASVLQSFLRSPVKVFPPRVLEVYFTDLFYPFTRSARGPRSRS